MNLKERPPKADFFSCQNCHLRVCAHSYLVLHHTYFQALTDMFFQGFLTTLSNKTSTIAVGVKLKYFFNYSKQPVLETVSMARNGVN